MALVMVQQRNLYKVLICSRRRLFYSSSSSLSPSSETRKDSAIKKSVFISQSKDIYTNLALEEWFYRNYDFTKQHVLLFWQNQPCIIIGKNQNPWSETNTTDSTIINNTDNAPIKIARRSTGGGTIYNDQGNLNMSFFTTRSDYDKNYNLNLIARGVFRDYGSNVKVSPQGNLTIRNTKDVSSGASKFGWPNAYHHCSLSVRTNKLDLRQALMDKNDFQIESNAIKSQHCIDNMMNLAEDNPKIRADNLIKTVGWEYLRTTPYTLKDGGMDFAQQQKGFQLLNPTEYWFPGITEIRNKLASWQWCYGETPNFTISRLFNIPNNLIAMNDDNSSLSSSSNNINNNSWRNHLKLTVKVEQGRIVDVVLLVPPPGLMSSGFSGNVKVITNFKGRKFSEETLYNLEQSFGGSINDKEKFVSGCLKQMMTSV